MTTRQKIRQIADTIPSILWMRFDIHCQHWKSSARYV